MNSASQGLALTAAAASSAHQSTQSVSNSNSS